MGFVWWLILLGGVLSVSRDAGAPMVCGVDASYVAAIEAAGGVYRDAVGQPADPFALLADAGVSMIRLRLWHTPEDGISGLDHTLALAERIYAHGMDVLLDFHYSDTWADPGHQLTPEAWRDDSYLALTSAIYAYTVEVLAAFNAQGTPPRWVQIGNEISSGMLWDIGRVGGRFDANWPQLIGLLQAASAAVRAAAPEARIMIHIDSGGDMHRSRWFFDHVGTSVDFDLIGLSFYPWWHGVLDDLSANMGALTARYGKPVVVVETAYPFTLRWDDNTHNVVGEIGQLHAGYRAAQAGQADFLQAVMNRVDAVPDDLGAGVFYWGAEWIAAPEMGSSWENLALFDFDGVPLPALEVLGACRGV